MVKALREKLLLFLLLAFVCAYWFPQLGLLIRKPIVSRGDVSAVHFLLAFLLFTAGINASDHLNWRSLAWLVHFGLVRSVMIGLFVLAAQSDSANALFGDWLAAIFLIMLLPAAGSSSGWCVQTGSASQVALTVILATTLASILVTPWGLATLATCVDDPTSPALGRLARGYSPGFAVPWVFAPALIGVILGRWASGRGGDVRALQQRLGAWVPVTLLALNYANASVGLSRFEGPGDALRLTLMTLVASGLLFVCSWAMSHLSSAQMADLRAGTFTASMSNTGLGLMVLVSAVPDHAGMHLTAILFTLAQHFWAAVFASVQGQTPAQLTPDPITDT